MEKLCNIYKKIIKTMMEYYELHSKTVDKVWGNNKTNKGGNNGKP